jgi:hypothetical protein
MVESVRDARAPLRRCPRCGVETHTHDGDCPACGSSYADPPPRLSRRARIALGGTLVALATDGLVLALLVPHINGNKHELAAAERAAQRERVVRERARLVAEQRPHRGRSSTRDDVHAGHARRLAERRALVRAAERAITLDARARIAAGALTAGYVRSTECGPLRRDLPRDELDVSKAIGRYDCVAVTQDVIQDGKVVAKFGIPFVAAIDFRHGRLTWCKNNPAPSERGKALASVRLKRVCLGLPRNAKPLGSGYVIPRAAPRGTAALL